MKIRQPSRRHAMPLPCHMPLVAFRRFAPNLHFSLQQIFDSLSHENQQGSIEADDDGHNKYSRSLILRYY
jgi:hypothetical protein